MFSTDLQILSIQVSQTVQAQEKSQEDTMD
jgi:hypothetical protein